MYIIFITPYPIDQAPSQRFRFEQFFNYLEKQNIRLQQASFLSAKAYSIFYKDDKSLLKTYYVVLGSIKRLFLLIRLPFYRYIFIHREAFPIGPPIYEWIIASVFRKRIIYDFDDSIWLEDPEEQGTIKAWMKCKWKVKHICKWSYKISVGNEFLANYAKQFNEDVIINPTTIDTEGYHNPELHGTNFSIQNKKVVIGWTGTHSTLNYLVQILPVIKKLEQEFDFTFLVIANKHPDFKLESLEFIKWSKSTEIEDLLKIDIGIMPLTDNNWSRGKCGFKALQYMALEKPALVSPVGVNKNIVSNGVNGFHCQSLKDWEDKIRYLIKNPSHRIKMGIEGRKTVEEHYSVASNKDNFLSLFE